MILLDIKKCIMEYQSRAGEPSQGV